MQLQKYENGATLIYENDTNTKCVVFDLVFTAGSSNEQNDELGISHFLEHLFFRGTDKYSKEELLKQFEKSGTKFNASTGAFRTKYTFKCLSEKDEETLSLISHILFCNEFTTEQVEQERMVILEEYLMTRDDPDDVIYDKYIKELYGDSDVTKHPIGAEEIIKSVTKEKLLEYKLKHYTAKNMIVSIGGNISFDRAKMLCEKYFINLIHNNSNSQNFIPLNKRELINHTPTNKVLVHDVPNRKQANINLVLNGVGINNKLSTAEDLYSAIMGQGFSSLMFSLLRNKKGLCYVTHGFSALAGQNSFFGFMIECSNEKMTLAIDGLYELIDDVAKNGVSDELLEIAKTQKKSTLIYGMEKLIDRLSYDENQLIYYGEITPLDDKIKKIENVTMQEINQIAKYVAENKNKVLAVYGSNIDAQKLNNQIKNK